MSCKNDGITAHRKTSSDAARKTVYLRFFSNLVLIGMLLFSMASFAQEAGKEPTFTVSGSVKDESGIPLSGVTVKVVGKNKTVISDNNGFYRIPLVSKNDKI